MTDDNPIWECFDECYLKAPLNDRKKWSTNITLTLVLRRYLEDKGYDDSDITDFTDRVVQGVNFDYYAGERGLRKCVRTTRRHDKTRIPTQIRLYPLVLKPEWERKLQVVGINRTVRQLREIPTDWGKK